MLVATDVAARGIHVDGVDVVVHYDPPEDEKAYLHRSGRTARAGESGVAVTLMLWNQENEVRVIQRRLGLQIPVVEIFSNDPRLLDLAELLGQPSSPTPDPTVRRGSCATTAHRPRQNDGDGDGPRARPWAHEPHLPTRRRHHRVRHPGGRRQGEGVAGRGRGRHRLRRR